MAPKRQLLAGLRMPKKRSIGAAKQRVTRTVQKASEPNVHRSATSTRSARPSKAAGPARSRARSQQAAKTAIPTALAAKIEHDERQISILNEGEYLTAGQTVSRLMRQPKISEENETVVPNLKFTFEDSPSVVFVRFLHRQGRMRTLDQEPRLLAVRANANIMGQPALDCRFDLDRMMFPTEQDAKEYLEKIDAENAEDIRKKMQEDLEAREQQCETKYLDNVHNDALRKAQAITRMISRSKTDREHLIPIDPRKSQIRPLVDRSTPEASQAADAVQQAFDARTPRHQMPRERRLLTDLLRRAIWIRVPVDLLNVNPAYCDFIIIRQAPVEVSGPITWA